MRISAGLTASLLGAALTLSGPIGGIRRRPIQAWQACIGATSAPDDRVSACSSVIDARSGEPAAGSRRPFATAATA